MRGSARARPVWRPGYLGAQTTLFALVCHATWTEQSRCHSRDERIPHVLLNTLLSGKVRLTASTDRPRPPRVYGVVVKRPHTCTRTRRAHVARRRRRWVVTMPKNYCIHFARNNEDDSQHDRWRYRGRWEECLLYKYTYTAQRGGRVHIAYYDS